MLVDYSDYHRNGWVVELNVEDPRTHAENASWAEGGKSDEFYVCAVPRSPTVRVGQGGPEKYRNRKPLLRGAASPQHCGGAHTGSRGCLAGAVGQVVTALTPGVAITAPTPARS